MKRLTTPILILLSIILFSFCNPQHQTPEQALEKLIEALNTGKLEALKAASTERGYNSIVSLISPFPEPDCCSVHLKNWGRSWGEDKIRWEVNSKDFHTAFMISEYGENKLEFRKYSKGWIFDNWNLENK